jgi:integrase/recombinase XerD
MPKSQKSNSHAKAIAFIDYKPAELCIKSQWLVVFYAKNPVTQKLERFRLSVPAISSKTERLKQGKKIVIEVNKKLDSGWLPYYSNNEANEFKSFEYCVDKFLEQTKKEVANGTKRTDTLRSYTSFLSMISKYAIEKKIKMNLVLEFNKPFVVNYLDWIYYERANSPRTFNNHLLFIGTFVNYCVERGYLKENFTGSISKKTNESKKRQILTLDVKEKVKAIQKENPHYFVLCMATYFCFLRRTELTKIKVADVNLRENYITIESENSKNKKTEDVTIPNAYINILAEHLKKANNNDYLFSANNFEAGKTQLTPKKISDTWEKFRKDKKVSSEYQFYSLKDTGITDLLNSGIPAIKVRDQARHYDLKITESYTARNKNCDDDVKNSSFDF